MKFLREIGITILIAIAIFVSIKATIQGYRAQYSCMLPNIEDGEWIMVSKASYFFSDPKRGEVIIFKPPEELRAQYPFIKRVIALPGETVEIKDGKVFINNIPIDEPYVFPEPPRRNKDFGPEKLLEGQYFVLGDNRNNSNDSRSWGTASRDDIIGKAWLIYWPPSKWGVVKHHGYSGLSKVDKREAVFCNQIEVQLE